MNHKQIKQLGGSCFFVYSTLINNIDLCACPD